MRHARFYTIWGVILVLGIVLITQFFSNTSLKKEIEKEQEGLELNALFVYKFFNYDSTRQRYDAIKPLMTEQGYQATYPSGFELPADSSVKSRVTKLRSFVQKAPEVGSNQMEILNEFMVTTEFNGIGSSKEVIMRTQLVHDGSSGWKVNDVEMIIQN